VAFIVKPEQLAAGFASHVQSARPKVFIPTNQARLLMLKPLWKNYIGGQNERLRHT